MNYKRLSALKEKFPSLLVEKEAGESFKAPKTLIY